MKRLFASNPEWVRINNLTGKVSMLRNSACFWNLQDIPEPEKEAEIAITLEELEHLLSGSSVFFEYLEDL